MKKVMSLKNISRILFMQCALLIATPSISAEELALPPLSDGSNFIHRDGETLYRAICQGCHMAKAEGAIGAGQYPALAKNGRLVAAAYPVYNVLHGLKGMPDFGNTLNDEQVAAVVNYVRTHFGNSYKDIVSAEDVKKLR